MDDKLYTKIVCAQIAGVAPHTIDDPAVEYGLKVVKVRERLQVVTDFWLDALDYGCDVPYTPDQTWLNVTQYDPTTNEIDADATNKLLAKFIKFCRSRGLEVKKEYDNNDFNIKVNIDPNPHGGEGAYGYNITTYANRASTCKQVVVGTRVVPAVPEHTEEIKEWDCTSNPISFLAMADDD